MTDYTIDEAAERMGLTKHTLRYYEREGLLAPIAKGSNGHRRYTDDDLAWVKFLQLLRATGMPIREMKGFVAITRAGDHTIPQRIQVLARYRAALVARMAEDAEHLERLDAKLKTYADLVGRDSGGVVAAARDLASSNSRS